MENIVSDLFVNNDEMKQFLDEYKRNVQGPTPCEWNFLSHHQGDLDKWWTFNFAIGYLTLIYILWVAGNVVYKYIVKYDQYYLLHCRRQRRAAAYYKTKMESKKDELELVGYTRRQNNDL